VSKSRYAYDLPSHDVEYGVSIPVADLRIDPLAQRALNERRAQSIADALVPEALGSIVVSERTDGVLYVVDGMHRKRVCELVGIRTMTAEVHKGLTQQEEALLFLIKNRESNKPNAFDEYKVGLTAGLPLFVDTDKVLRYHGLELGSTTSGSIGAVAGVLRITETFGPDVLDRTLTVAEGAWGRAPTTWDGMLLGGIGMFLGKHGDVVNDTDLALKIAKHGPAGAWVGKVHAVSSGGGLHNSGTGSRIATCYAMVKIVWNKGKTKNRIA
jgi:hypothetical protein